MNFCTEKTIRMQYEKVHSIAVHAMQVASKCS